MIPTPPRPDLERRRADGSTEQPVASEPVPWRWWHAIGLYLVGHELFGLVIASIVFGAMDATAETAGLRLPGIVASILGDAAFVTLMVIWLRRVASAPFRSIRLAPAGERLRALVGGIGAGLVLYPLVAIVVGGLLTALFRAVFGQDVSTPDQLAPDLGVAAKAFAVVFAIVAAPVTEELFFRGILFQSLRRYGFWAAALGSGVLFGLVHYVGGPWQGALLLQAAMIVTGIGLAFIYERRGLLGSIGAHVAFNAIGILVVLTIR
jgi:membrane protease YdiL (CAAX protease family)